MNKPVNRPDRVAPEALDDAIEAGVERAQQVNELTKDDLSEATGGVVPGKYWNPDPEPF